MVHTVLDYLDRDVENNPDKIGYADSKTEVSYRMLDEKSDAVASYIAARVCQRHPVVVLANKSCDVVAAFLGTAKAGCFYVPVDPKHPTARINTVLNAVEPEVIIADASGMRIQKNLNEKFTHKIIAIEDLFSIEINKELIEKRRRAIVDIDPLYAIFTSGSTGKPKGVLVSHASVTDFIEEFTTTFNFSDEDVFGNQAPFDFDVSVKDIYSGLRCGARVEILEKSLFSFPVNLVERLNERKVTTLVWAVSALVIVATVDALTENRPQDIRNILFSGEAFPVKHLNYWRDYYPSARFVNLYGPTEITCNCTYYEIKKSDVFASDQALPIGSAFGNEKVFLLDDNRKEITEPDVLGEICVSGKCVSLGYLNDFERTEQAFCQNPCNSSWREVIYKTGDLAKYGSDGLLYFFGRKDFQIKHMGHRIELQEIEMSIHDIDGVDRCCCVFFKDRQKIVAFYEGVADKKEIISHLKKVVPVYMIPQVFVVLDKLPITANGKIDRSLLATYQVD